MNLITNEDLKLLAKEAFSSYNGITREEFIIVKRLEEKLKCQ